MPRISPYHRATNTIKDRIAKATAGLTPSYRQLADYVLSHSFRAATMTIDELAEATNVSTATVNRFAHKLGFSGFPGFRAELVRGFESALAPVERLRDELTRETGCADVMAASLADTAANLETLRAINPA